jgi:hypothetical protein
MEKKIRNISWNAKAQRNDVYQEQEYNYVARIGVLAAFFLRRIELFWDLTVIQWAFPNFESPVTLKY